MSSGKREFREQKGKKLNILKVLIVIILIIVVIVGIISLIKYINKDTNLEEKKEELETSLENNNSVEEKSIEDIVAEFGGEVKEKIKSDTYYVEKEGKEYTVYSDGEIVDGRVVMWDGTSQKPAIDEAGNINIYNPAELRWIAEQVSSGEKSFAGVTINLRSSLDFGARKNEEGAWEGIAWSPIIGFLEETQEQKQTNNSEEQMIDETVDVTQEYLKRFAGTFIGNGFSIRGLYINTNSRYSGLFGYQTGVITNLIVKNSFITGAESVGTLVGLNGGTIQNCSVKDVEVIGTEKVGGLVGTTMTSSTIEGCKTEGTKNLVVGDKYVGGIVGYVNNNANISQVLNAANISGSEYVGGVAGISFYATVIKSASNYAEKIVGEQYVGGLVGYSQSQIEKSSNQSKGSVTAQNYVGGLVGANYIMGNITDCFNTARVVSSKDNCGGIVGINNANIANCYNTGEIDGSEAEGNKIGGICGQNVSDSYIYTSYNIGKIKASFVAGGVVGANFGTISNCYFLNTISNQVPKEDYSKTEEEMKNSILENLGENYKQDLDNKNEGYQILSWQ